MVIGSFANKTLEVSSNKVFSIDSVSKTAGLDIEEQEVEGSKPKIYVKNAQLKTISFTIKLYAGLGVNIDEEIKSWESMLESKTVGDFILYNTKINNKWLLIGVKTNKEVLTNRIEIASIDIDLKEFVGYGAKKEKEEDKKSSSKKTASTRTKTSKQK